MPGKDINPRTCIVTRTEKSPDEMIRFVLDPEKRVVPDLKRNLPGRGVWVTAEKSLLFEAVNKQLFSRGFKTSANADETLIELTERLMKAGLAGYLSLARKAGVLFTGQKKVEDMVRGNAAALLFLAADSEGEGKRKLLQTVEKLSSETLVYEVFNSDELDEITGGVNTVHIGLTESGIASNIAAAAGKVEKFSRCT